MWVAVALEMLSEAVVVVVVVVTVIAVAVVVVVVACQAVDNVAGPQLA